MHSSCLALNVVTRVIADLKLNCLTFHQLYHVTIMNTDSAQNFDDFFQLILIKDNESTPRDRSAHVAKVLLFS